MDCVKLMTSIIERAVASERKVSSPQPVSREAEVVIGGLTLSCDLGSLPARDVLRIYIIQWAAEVWKRRPYFEHLTLCITKHICYTTESQPLRNFVMKKKCFVANLFISE